MAYPPQRRHRGELLPPRPPSGGAGGVWPRIHCMPSHTPPLYGLAYMYEIPYTVCFRMHCMLSHTLYDLAYTAKMAVLSPKWHCQNCTARMAQLSPYGYRYTAVSDTIHPKTRQDGRHTAYPPTAVCETLHTCTQ